MKRRKFIALLGAAATWPLAAVAQRPERIRRVGVLMNTAADDPVGQTRIAAFLQGLQHLGWSIGHNIEIDTRWAAGDAGRIQGYANELVGLTPDVILATGSATVGPLQRASRSLPIVFVTTVDPVGGGFVESLARPGTNATGFIAFEYGMGGKWLELLKQIAPGVTRVAVIRDAEIASGPGQFGAIQSVAPAFGVELRAVGLRDPGEMERIIKAFARPENGGLIVTPSALTLVLRATIIAMAARQKLPAIYPTRHFVIAGGLACYGPDLVEQYRQAASYVDRILNGEKPADLPVQAPTKFELAINLKTAKALGLTISPALLARANEVIE